MVYGVVKDKPISPASEDILTPTHTNSSQKQLPRLPRSDAMFEGLPSAIVDWDKLEGYIARRADFHGYVEVRSSQAHAQMVFVNAVLQQTQIASETITDAHQIDGSIALYPLAPQLARQAAKLGGALLLDLHALIQTRGLVGTVIHLENIGASGLLRLHTDVATSAAEVYLERGQSYGLWFEQHFGSVSSIDGLGAMISRLEGKTGRATFAQTAAPLKPLEVAAVVSQSAGLALEQILAAWSELMRRARGLADASAFDRAWRETSVALADDHPLLDPFMGELTWKDAGGKPALQLHADPKETSTEAFMTSLVAGLSAGVTQTTNRLKLTSQSLQAALNLTSLEREYPRAGLERLLDQPSSGRK